MKLNPYAKAVLAGVGGALVVLKAALTDGGVDPQEWADIAIAFGVAAGVWAVPNRTPAPVPQPTKRAAKKR